MKVGCGCVARCPLQKTHGSPAPCTGCTGAALADVWVGRKAHQHHLLSTLLMLLALAQFVATGLLPLSHNAYFIAGAGPRLGAPAHLQGLCTHAAVTCPTPGQARLQHALRP